MKVRFQNKYGTYSTTTKYILRYNGVQRCTNNNANNGIENTNINWGSHHKSNIEIEKNGAQ